MNTWEEIRTTYVNGNIAEAKEELYQKSKTKIFKIISEALESHYEYWNPRDNTFSGDLQDLRELVSKLARGIQ